MKNLYIIGAGSVGGFVASNFEDFKLKYKLAGFLDDDEKKIGTEFCGLPILDKIESIKRMKGIALIIGIAFPKIKEQILNKIISSKEIEFPSLIHPQSWISKDVSIGKGVIIYPNCSINYGSVIGDFVVMNMNCAIGHHTSIGKFCSLAPGVQTGGHTRILEGADIGVGAATKQNITIGKYAVIGGQTMLIKDVKDYETIVGVPGRKIL